MCGINLIWTKNSVDLEERIARMNRSIRHRGPDGEGHQVVNFWESQLGIGNVRLEVVAGADGQQPKTNQNETYVMSFNGYVSNYKDLKQKHHLPEELTTDTAVVFELLCRFGTSAVEEFNGMFCLVFVDVLLQKIHLLRDSSGIKSLYYARRDDELIVSSELRTFEGFEFNSNEIPHYLYYRYPKIGNTFYSGVHELEKGGVLTFSKEGQDWQAFNPSVQEKKDLKTILQRAVQRNMDDTEKTALLFSGGLDSSLLLALAERKEHLLCVTIGDAQLLNETKTWCEDIGCEHLGISEAVFNEAALEQFFDTIDTPVADPAAFLTWVVAKRLKERGIKVALSGAGADEWFAGYNRHKAFAYLSQKSWELSCFRALLNVFPAKLLAQIPSKIIDLIKNKETLDFEAYTALSAEWSGLSRPHTEQVDTFLKALRFDAAQYLVGDVLKISDMASMCHGVELRVPFLDQELVDRAKHYSMRELLDKGGKGPLKKIALDLSLSSLLNKEKTGFGIGLKEILEDETHFIYQYLSREELKVWSFLPFRSFQQVVKKHCASEKEYSREIWSVYVLSKFLEKHG